LVERALKFNFFGRLDLKGFLDSELVTSDLRVLATTRGHMVSFGMHFCSLSDKVYQGFTSLYFLLGRSESQSCVSIAIEKRCHIQSILRDLQVFN